MVKKTPASEEAGYSNRQLVRRDFNRAASLQNRCAASVLRFANAWNNCI
jgi:hypothetical protein